MRRLATGGGFATRQLTTDQDEVLLIDVQANDLLELGGKLQIVGQLELAHQMRPQTYGDHFAEGCRDDEKLGDVLHKMDEPSLSKLLARSAENWTRFADMPHDERPSTPCRSRCPPAQAS